MMMIFKFGQICYERRVTYIDGFCCTRKISDSSSFRVVSYRMRIYHFQQFRFGAMMYQLDYPVPYLALLLTLARFLDLS